MTDTTADSPGQPDAASDPFVTQVGWLIATAGGTDQLVQRSGGLVSTRTLDNWAAGNYPRTKVTGAVRDLDAWARAELPGYPEAAGVPGLVDSCGPYRGASAAAALGTATGPELDRTGPETTPAERRRLPWVLTGAALVALAVVLIAILLIKNDSPDAAPEPKSAAELTVDVPLRSTGDGTPVEEQTGSIGANT